MAIYPIKELLEGLEYKIIGEIKNPMINRFIDHSKQIQKGDVFVSETNNPSFIGEAIKNGAVAVLTENFIPDCAIPQIIVPYEMFLIKDKISYMTYQKYGQKIKVVGITGTNGKTTVASFTGQLLMQYGKSVCVIGTLGVYVNGKKLERRLRNNTTLPFYDFIQVIHYCYEHQIEYIVLEASSQGLLDNRLGSYPIDVATFLNIGRDHLEFHGGMVPYKKSKELLVLLARNLVVNDNDEWCRSVAQRAYLPTKRFGGRSHNEVIFSKEGYLENPGQFEFIVQGEKISIDMPNAGYHNGLNLGAAIANLLTLGFPCKDIQPVRLPDGRLDSVENKQGIEVLIDYAHTPDALEACLAAVASYAKRNIYVVFGCGGNRDKQKRKWMGEVATNYATKAIITSDNPRYEDPNDIITEIIRGADRSKVIIEPNRKKAIRRALEIAQSGDVVLIAGKGHEKEQIVKNEILPFSDLEEVTNYFSELEGGVITKKDPVA